MAALPPNAQYGPRQRSHTTFASSRAAETIERMPARRASPEGWVKLDLTEFLSTALFRACIPPDRHVDEQPAEQPAGLENA